NLLNDVANMAQAGLGYYQAEKGRNAANQAVADAQKRLDAARRDGNPELIRQAQTDLDAAKATAESALMGGSPASESLLSTARDIGDRHHQAHVLTDAFKAADASVKDGQDKQKQLAAIVNDSDLPLDVREQAMAEYERLQIEGKKLTKSLDDAKG